MQKIFISFERLSDFNEIFRKDVPYDNIKGHEKGFALSLEVTFLEKPQGASKN